MANRVEPCDSCKTGDSCPVPQVLAKEVVPWNVPNAIFEYPFAEVISSWRQADGLLVKLQCSRYKNSRTKIFSY